MNPQTTITAEDVREMIFHHLHCPPNGYLGSPFGSDVKSMLQTPMASDSADAFISKLREDIPLLAVAGLNINIYYKDELPDRRYFVIEVGGIEVVLEL